MQLVRALFQFHFPQHKLGSVSKMSKRKSSSAPEKPTKRAKAAQEDEVEDENDYDSDEDHLLSRQVTATIPS